jgi:hypothetical protein
MTTIGKETVNQNLGVACLSFKKIKVPYSLWSKTLILLRRQKKIPRRWTFCYKLPWADRNG